MDADLASVTVLLPIFVWMVAVSLSEVLSLFNFSRKGKS